MQDRTVVGWIRRILGLAERRRFGAWSHEPQLSPRVEDTAPPSGDKIAELISVLGDETEDKETRKAMLRLVVRSLESRARLLHEHLTLLRQVIGKVQP